MISVGWLEAGQSNGVPDITIPKFTSWLSRCAKGRRKKALRQKVWRSEQEDSKNIDTSVALFETEKGQRGKGKGKSTEETGERAKEIGKTPCRAGSQHDRSGLSLATDLVITHYCDLHPRAKPGDKERRLIQARLKDGFTADDLIDAIDGNHRDPHCSGQNPTSNPTGKKYHNLTLIMKDASKVQQYMEVPLHIAVGAGMTAKEQRGAVATHWYELHSACFPAVNVWLGKFGEAEAVKIASEWFRLLRRCDLDDCVRASRLMFSDEENQPRGHSQHPTAVARLARSYRREREHAAAQQERWHAPVDGEPTFACLDCRDEGTIDVFHPHTAEDLQRVADGERIIVYTTSRACPCKAGDQYRRLCGTFDKDDLQITYRDGDGGLCWYDPNESADRAKLLEMSAGMRGGW
jgi:hypothetical protein